MPRGAAAAWALQSGEPLLRIPSENILHKRTIPPAITACRHRKRRRSQLHKMQKETTPGNVKQFVGRTGGGPAPPQHVLHIGFLLGFYHQTVGCNMYDMLRMGYFGGGQHVRHVGMGYFILFNDFDRWHFRPSTEGLCKYMPPQTASL